MRWLVGLAGLAGLVVLARQSPPGSIIHQIAVAPFRAMADAPDLLAQSLWEGFVGGMLYGLIALGFVLIYKASRVFNFAQGILVVFSSLALIEAYELYVRLGLPRSVGAYLALLSAIAVVFVLAALVERFMLRRLVNQSDLILFMATIGLNYLLIGVGEIVFGGVPRQMITESLGLPQGYLDLEMLGGRVSIQMLDIAAASITLALIVGLTLLFRFSSLGRSFRAVAEGHQAALSVGISLNRIWVIVWFAAGVVALVTGIAWGARSDVSFGLQAVALKALPVLILGGFTSIPGAIIGGLIIGIGEKIGEFYWGPLLGSGIESWLAYIIALSFLIVRPHGLFGDRAIERI
ncbi:MAG: branched-chain amino acid ABC transporter permease [Bosea sp.]|nr:branched-chain amino acid ABC transporter permease [Bosea sp. (in: a-proteobacteria)]